MKKNAGFTLGEVLVVTAIFFIMIAILGPFVKMARKYARKINCANNLRKIGLGLHSYAAEHDDKFPPNLEALYPNYVEDPGVFDCPATKSVGTRENPDYSYNAALTELSMPKEIISSDKDGNHKKSGRNILRVNGSVEWIGNQ